MAKVFAYLILLVKLTLLKGDEELVSIDNSLYHHDDNGSEIYSFGYGVSDAQTGDIKTVWESKEGDNVKGHYSLMEPDGSVRTVEYSAGPGKGFIAAVNNDALKSQTVTENPQTIQDKSYRDYKKPYEVTEDESFEFYSSSDKKNKKYPHGSFYADYSSIKRPSYSSDSEPSDFLYDSTIKHLRDVGGYNDEGHSHMRFSHNPNCKIKHTKESGNYKTTDSLDFRRHKYPLLFSDSYNYDKYSDSYNDDDDKYPFHYKLKDQYKSPRPDEVGIPTSIKYSYPVLPDMPISENSYKDDMKQRSKKKHRLHKNTEGYYFNDDDFILVPKKKIKKPPRMPEINNYPPEDIDEDYDQFDEDDDRNYKPPRESVQKEFVRKIIKKRKPSIIKFLDILDI
ncbi:uncharacterized protein [Battus philenor]|uniref:uncharacterized protein n=1 Tax=Battus philenor TaxID=42288 RepID=UPI0035D0DE2B